MPRPEKKTPEELENAILEALGDGPRGLSTAAICKLVGVSAQTLGTPFENLLKAGRVHGFAGHWISPAGFEEGTSQFLEALAKTHERQPTISMVPRERVVHQAGLGWAGKALDRILANLAAQKLITVSGVNIRLRGFRPQLPKRQREFLDRAKAELETEFVNTPNAHEIARRLGAPHQAVEEILHQGHLAGEVHELGDGIYYTPQQMTAIMDRLREALQDQPFGAGEMRKALGTTRKYVIPLLQHLDEVEFTTHDGENRFIRSPLPEREG